MKNENEKLGLRLSSYICNEMLLICGMTYQECLEFTKKLEIMVKQSDFLELYDGTTYYKTFTPIEKRG